MDEIIQNIEVRLNTKNKAYSDDYVNKMNKVLKDFGISRTGTVKMIGDKFTATYNSRSEMLDDEWEKLDDALNIVLPKVSIEFEAWEDEDDEFMYEVFNVTL